MQELLEMIRQAVAKDATAQAKVAGAQACRTILTALEAEPGKPMALPGTPAPNPLVGMDINQALDLLIARLSAALPPDDGTASQNRRPGASGMRLTLVRPPARPTRRGR